LPVGTRERQMHIPWQHPRNGGEALFYGNMTGIEPVNGTLTWADGDASPKEFQVPILNDGMAEEDETVVLVLEEPAENSWLNSVESAELTIQANDSGAGSSGGCFVGALSVDD